MTMTMTEHQSLITDHYLLFTIANTNHQKIFFTK